MKSNQVVVSTHEAVPKYLRELGKLDEDAVILKHLDPEDPKKDIEGKEVFCLQKLEWARHAEKVWLITVDMGKLGKSLSEATHLDLARVSPTIRMYTVFSDEPTTLDVISQKYKEQKMLFKASRQKRQKGHQPSLG